VDLILVRHARPVRIDDSDASADPELTPLGHRQAAAAAGWLALEPIDRSYCSPKRRARETAEPLARALSIDIVSVEGLREYDEGDTSYIPAEEMRGTEDPRWQRAIGGLMDEEGMQFRDTVSYAIEAIINDNPGRTVAIFCHGGVINAYLAHILDIERTLFFEPYYSSITRVKASSRGHRTLVSANETAHLRGLID
jgi:broad specificity phosphatase PhoE